jgi:hypothetical protein
LPLTHYQVIRYGQAKFGSKERRKFGSWGVDDMQRYEETCVVMLRFYEFIR